MRIIGLLFILFCAACSSGGPQPIRYGNDQCAHCKMTVSDPRFGAQLVTTKGRAYNFDDVYCMTSFIKKGNLPKTDIAGLYLPDYSNDHQLFPAMDLYYLKSESLKSPMRGDLAAFKSTEDLEEVKKVHGGKVLTWDEILK